MLIPLLGTHFIVFILVNPSVESGSDEKLESTKIFFEVVLTSFEGIMSEFKKTYLCKAFLWSFDSLLFYEHWGSKGRHFCLDKACDKHVSFVSRKLLHNKNWRQGRREGRRRSSIQALGIQSVQGRVRASMSSITSETTNITNIDNNKISTIPNS